MSNNIKNDKYYNYDEIRMIDKIDFIMLPYEDTTTVPLEPKIGGLIGVLEPKIGGLINWMDGNKQFKLKGGLYVDNLNDSYERMNELD
jgi:hypothetical protein